METTISLPAYYHPRELSIMLNVSIKTITKWTQARRVPGQIKCGGLWRYDRDAVDRARRSGVLLLPSINKAA